MARTWRQLLLLLSLLSSSFQLFRQSAHAHESPADFRSRVSRLQDTQTLLMDYLEGVRDSRRQHELGIRTSSDADDCGHYGCGVYGSSGKLTDAADSVVVLPQTYPKDWPLVRGREESAQVLDPSAQRPWRAENNHAREDGSRKQNELSAKLQHSYANRLDAEFSSFKNALLRFAQQKNPLNQNAGKISFTRRSEDLSSDFPFWATGDFQADTNKKQTDDDDNSVTARYFEDGEENHQNDLVWKENVFKRAESEASSWENSQPDFQHLISQPLSLPQLIDLQETGNQGINLANEFPDPATRTASTPHWARVLGSRLHTSTGTDGGSSLYTPEPSPTKRVSESFNDQVFVHGHDDRHRVLLPQMRKFPFSNIARLSTGCTGTLVTPRHVLTAAHCVHNGLGFRDNLEKLKIQIPDTMGFKNYYAQKITIPTGWLRYGGHTRARRRGGSGKRAMYDYAVVHLTLAVAGRTRFLPLAVPRPEVLQMDFHFLAFPEDDRRLWRSVCLASQHMALGDGNLIMTRCDAAVGNSGAAVFIQDPNHGGLKVVGVLSNTMHVGHHRSFLRYSIITALTWPKLNHICQELDVLGQIYSVCPPPYMRRPPSARRQTDLQVVPFFGKRVPHKRGGYSASLTTSPSKSIRSDEDASSVWKRVPHKRGGSSASLTTSPSKSRKSGENASSSAWKRFPAERGRSSPSSRTSPSTTKSSSGSDEGAYSVWKRVPHKVGRSSPSSRTSPTKSTKSGVDASSSVWKRFPAERGRSGVASFSSRMFKRRRRFVDEFPVRKGVPDTRGRFGFLWREIVPGSRGESTVGSGMKNVTENSSRHLPQVRDFM